MTKSPSFRDVEKLSAYLDGQLKPSETARLESRIQSDPELASILKDLRQARSLLRQLPQRRAPRNFTLTPKMVGQKPPLPRAYPVFRFATVLATLLLFFTFATNFMAPRLARPAAPLAYGMGGGGGGGAPELSAEAATEAPAAPAIEAPAQKEPTSQALTAPELPLPAPTLTSPSVEDNSRIVPTPQSSEKSGVQAAPTAENFAQQSVPNQIPPTQPPKRPINATLQVVLALVALLSGLIALFLRYTAIRKWHERTK
jgi:hypothetical protein